MYNMEVCNNRMDILEHGDKQWRNIVWFEGCENRLWLELIEKLAKELKLGFRKYNTETVYGENYDILCTRYMHKKFSKRFIEEVSKELDDWDWIDDKVEELIKICRRFNLKL